MSAKRAVASPIFFSYCGEAYFRELETRLVKHLHKLKNHVVSTGGGVLTTDGNLELLQEAGLTVFLNADRSDILQRLECDVRRPKLKEGNLEETVNRLLDERMERYCASRIIINTKGKGVNGISGEIIRSISDIS